MDSTLSIALSGLNAATQRLNTSARNIAGSGSSQYAPQQITQTSNAGGGVTTQVTQVPATATADNDSASPFAQNLANASADPAGQLVQANIAAYDARGNMSVIKVQNNLFKSLMDIVA